MWLLKIQKEDFVNVGVPASLIKVTGIPISDKFEADIIIRLG